MDFIRWRELTMMKRFNRIAAIATTTVLLTLTAVPVQASGQLPILKACLAEAEKASDPQAARNHCLWTHYELMAEYGMD